jgi:molybdopterin-guanine dinucleotide biosynthesis protein B
MTETPECNEMNLSYLASRFDSASLDLILVEGFKSEPIDKIALFRSDVGKPLNGLIDEYVVAVASDEIIDTDVPQLDINNPEQVADYIVSWWQKSQ